MKNRPHATWWDIATELDLLVCDAGPSGCQRGWGINAHKFGRVDHDGVIHWKGFNGRANTNGLPHRPRHGDSMRLPEACSQS